MDFIFAQQDITTLDLTSGSAQQAVNILKEYGMIGSILILIMMCYFMFRKTALGHAFTRMLTGRLNNELVDNLKTQIKTLREDLELVRKEKDKDVSLVRQENKELTNKLVKFLTTNERRTTKIEKIIKKSNGYDVTESTEISIDGSDSLEMKKILDDIQDTNEHLTTSGFKYKKLI